MARWMAFAHDDAVFQEDVKGRSLKKSREHAPASARPQVKARRSARITQRSPREEANACVRGCALWGAGAQSPGWVRQRTIPRGASLHRAPLPFATAIAHVYDAHQTFCADHVAQKKSLTQGARLLF